MRGLRSIATGQRVLATVEAMQAISRGDWHSPVPAMLPTMRAFDRVRCEAMALLLLANNLRSGCPAA